jgi:RNA polymerase sigma factor (sigma-70 family)
MPPSDSDLTLWFARHVQPHEALLRAWLQSRFRNEDDFDDIVQETYLRLLRALERGEVASPKAFLFTVARNLAIDRFRHRKVVPTESLAENDALAVFEEGRSTPELIAHNQELELLTEAIQSLPDRCRQIFTLRKVYGLAQAEIAAQLGISENTVSAQLTIGVKKCMAFMLQCQREREGRWP